MYALHSLPLSQFLALSDKYPLINQHLSRLLVSLYTLYSCISSSIYEHAIYTEIHSQCEVGSTSKVYI